MNGKVPITCPSSCLINPGSFHHSLQTAPAAGLGELSTPCSWEPRVFLVPLPAIPSIQCGEERPAQEVHCTATCWRASQQLVHRGWEGWMHAGSLVPPQINLGIVLGYYTWGNTSLFALLLGITEPDIRLKYGHGIVLTACISGVVSLTTSNPGSWFSTINYIFLSPDSLFLFMVCWYFYICILVASYLKACGTRTEIHKLSHMTPPGTVSSLVSPLVRV